MRKTGIVAAGIVLALTVVGCGSKEAGTPVAAGGSGNTSSAPTGGVEKKDFGSALDLANAINTKSDAKKSAKIAFTVGVAGQAFKGDGAINADGDKSAMQMTMDVGGMKMEMILVDKVLYMKLPAGAGGGSASKPWRKVTADGTDPLSKQMASTFENIDDSFDIEKQVDQIKSAGTINKTTKEQLDGEEVTHYDITIDTAKLAASAPTPETKESAKALQSAGVKSFDMDWWINSDELPVKITSTIPGPNNVTVNMEATYKDWGKPVDIKAPPADQVATN